MGTSLTTNGRRGETINNETTLLNTSDGGGGGASLSAANKGLNLDGSTITNSTASPNQPPQTQDPSYWYDPTNNSTNFTDISRQSSASLNESQSTNSTSTGLATNSEEFNLKFFGTSIYPLQWLTPLSSLTSWLRPLSSLAMIIGCVMPYVPQYITIYKIRNCSGFSTFVCLTLLLANILRVAFWFGHPFETPLLVQSVIMILAQLLLLELCVRVKRQSSNSVRYHKKRSLFTSSPRFFWRWTDLISYLEFLCLVSVLLGLAMYFLIDCEPFVEATGYLALVTESMLGLPQVIKNYKKKSVEGMSLSMVLMWLGGDIFKTAYFVVNDVPLQFWLCGLLQITIDLLILFQVCLFRRNAPIKMNMRANDSPKEMMAL